MDKKPDKPSNRTSQEEKTPATTTQEFETGNLNERQTTPSVRAERNNAENEVTQTTAPLSNEPSGGVQQPSGDNENVTPAATVPEKAQKPLPTPQQGPIIRPREIDDEANPNQVSSHGEAEKIGTESSNSGSGHAVKQSENPNLAASGNVHSVSRLEQHRPPPILIPSSKTGIDDHLAASQSIHPISRSTTPSTPAPSTSGATQSNNFKSPASLERLSPSRCKITPRAMARGLPPWMSPTSPPMLVERVTERSSDPLGSEQLEIPKNGANYKESDMGLHTSQNASDDSHRPVEQASSSEPQVTEVRTPSNDGISHQKEDELFPPRTPQTPQPGTPLITETFMFQQTPRIPKTPRSFTPPSRDIQSQNTTESVLAQHTPRLLTPRPQFSQPQTHLRKDMGLSRMSDTPVKPQSPSELSLGCNKNISLLPPSSCGQGSSGHSSKHHVQTEENERGELARHAQLLLDTIRVTTRNSVVQDMPSVIPPAPRTPSAPRIPKTTSRIRAKIGSLQSLPSVASRSDGFTPPVVDGQNAMNIAPTSPTAITDFPGGEQRAALRSTERDTNTAPGGRQGPDALIPIGSIGEREETEIARENTESEQEHEKEAQISTSYCKSPKHTTKKDEDDDPPDGTAGNNGAGNPLSRSLVVTPTNRKRNSLADDQPRKRQPQGRSRTENSIRRKICEDSKDRESSGPNQIGKKASASDHSPRIDRSRKNNGPQGTLPASHVEQLQPNFERLTTRQDRRKKEMTIIPEGIGSNSDVHPESYGDSREEGSEKTETRRGEANQDGQSASIEQVASILANELGKDRSSDMPNLSETDPVNPLRSEEQLEARSGPSTPQHRSLPKRNTSHEKQSLAAQTLKKATSEPRGGRDSPEIEAWLEKPRLPRPRRYYGERIIRSNDVIIYETSPKAARSRYSNIPTPQRDEPSAAERQKRLREHQARIRRETGHATQGSVGGPADIDLVPLNLGSSANTLEKEEGNDSQEHSNGKAKTQ